MLVGVDPAESVEPGRPGGSAENTMDEVFQNLIYKSVFTENSMDDVFSESDLEKVLQPA